jgi:hypothetical protein
MASHATALGINSFAYIYARRHSKDKSFNFGTGKVNTLDRWMRYRGTMEKIAGAILKLE